MTFASIDIGSNAVRLLISRVISEDGRTELKKVEFVRVPLRLGDDVFRTGKVSKEKKQLLYKSLEAYKLLMEVHQVDDYIACGTSAMREASNGKKIMDKVLKEFDLKIEIISGKRESEIILKSVMNYFPENGNYLNIDVGGGSTEMTVIDDHKPVLSVSFDIGTVRLLDGMVPAYTWKQIEKWVIDNTARFKSLTGIGTSGTINKLYRMGQKGKEGFLAYQKLEEMYEMLRAMSIQDRIEKLKLNPDRADIIEPAALIYLKIMKWANIEKLYAPEAGLKDGIMHELMERNGFIPTVEI